VDDGWLYAGRYALQNADNCPVCPVIDGTDGTQRNMRPGRVLGQTVIKYLTGALWSLSTTLIHKGEELTPVANEFATLANVILALVDRRFHKIIILFIMWQLYYLSDALAIVMQNE